VADDLQRLIDERDIRNVLMRYCRGIDRLELELVRECFHADARDDHGAFEGGVEQLLDWIGRLLPRYGVTVHRLTNILVEFHPDQDDLARVESYGIAEHQTPGGPRELNLSIAFRYLDRFERRDGSGWKIADRFCTTEIVRAHAPADDFPFDARFARGGRGGRSDRVFQPWD
jgi:hypothetical protein